VFVDFRCICLFVISFVLSLLSAIVNTLSPCLRLFWVQIALLLEQMRWKQCHQQRHIERKRKIDMGGGCGLQRGNNSFSFRLTFHFFNSFQATELSPFPLGIVPVVWLSACRWQFDLCDLCNLEITLLVGSPGKWNFSAQMRVSDVRRSVMYGLSIVFLWKNNF